MTEGSHEQNTDQGNELSLHHLQSIWDDMREEMRLRIQQRDNYAIQMIVTIGVIAVISASVNDTLLNSSGVIIYNFAIWILLFYPSRLYIFYDIDTIQLSYP